MDCRTPDPASPPDCVWRLLLSRLFISTACNRARSISSDSWGTCGLCIESWRQHSVSRVHYRLWSSGYHHTLASRRGRRSRAMAARCRFWFDCRKGLDLSFSIRHKTGAFSLAVPQPPCSCARHRSSSHGGNSRSFDTSDCQTVFRTIGCGCNDRFDRRCRYRIFRKSGCRASAFHGDGRSFVCGNNLASLLAACGILRTLCPHFAFSSDWLHSGIGAGFGILTIVIVIMRVLSYRTFRKRVADWVITILLASLATIALIVPFAVPDRMSSCYCLVGQARQR